jgi:hypothetical protein
VLADGGEAKIIVPGQPACRFRGQAVLEGTRADLALAGLDLCAAPAITLAPPR